MKRSRGSTLRLLLVVGVGALTAASVTWMLWGLVTPGDYFAGGNPLVWGTLVIGALAGGYAASRLRSRRAVRLLVFAAALCTAFWLVVPDGWWAAAPPPPQSLE